MTRRYKGVLFDLGNTLVRYYTKGEIAQVLRECLLETWEYLASHGIAAQDKDYLIERFEPENHEALDFRVRPLWDRLVGSLELDESTIADDSRLDIQRASLNPIFARAKLYNDSIPTLNRLKQKGYITGIISNTPWGSPGALWREEIASTTAIFGVDFFSRLFYNNPS